MGDMAFGGGFEMMRDGDQGNILHLIEKGTQSTSMTGHVPWLFRYLAKLPKFGNSKFRDFAINRADLRRKQGSLRKDLFHYIFDEAGVEPHPPILEEALSDGILAIAAGSDTTSHVMSNIFWFLLRHPSCYERLQAEIDAAFPRGTPATDVAKQSELPYLEAVINETLRLQPPVPSGAQRSTQYTDGKMAGTHWIPKGTQVQINTYSIQRDPRYFWPAPEGFWPDRWLDHAQRKSNEVVEYKDPNSIILETRAFIPFSFGPAMCVAKKFATMEMKMVVCLVLHTFQLRFADGWNANEWEEKIGDYFTATRGPMPVVLTPRA